MGGIIPHQEILRRNEGRQIFNPFVAGKEVQNGKSYGVSQCGYDIRIKQDITLYPVSLKNLILKALGFKRDSFALASTVEAFSMPVDLVGCVADKSSWAREGLAVQNTVIEPGWKGFLTLELTNHSDEVIRIKAGDPIAQVLLHQLTEATTEPYNGKYQWQDDRPVPSIKESGSSNKHWREDKNDKNYPEHFY